MMTESAQDRVLDLFAGPGGWSQGLRMLGLSDVGIEWDDAACRTRKAAGHLTIRADVAAYPTEPFVGKVWGLIASPPCQDFSLAGKRAGIAGDRGQLVWQVLRWADALRPAWIACEQVPPVLEIWQHMAHEMRGWGYRTWVGILNAADYGVPQTRKRAFLLAIANTVVQPPAPTHGKDTNDGLWGSLLPWVTMSQALGWGMDARPCTTVTAGGGRQGGPDPLDGGSGSREALRREQREGRWVQRERSGDRAEEGFDPQAIPSQALTSKARSWVVKTGANSMKHSRNGSRAGDGGVVPYERSIDEPAPTLDTKVGSAWTIGMAGAGPAAENTAGQKPRRLDEPAHTITGADTAQWVDVARPASDRREGSIRVSAAEASILQSFPADYPWQGSRSKQFEQIGNAVPPLLAAHVLSSVTGIALNSEVAA